MSRAFMSKEQEGDAVVADLPERPLSAHPNYVTPNGLARLEAQRTVLFEQRRQLIAQAEDDIAKAEILRHVERDIRYFDARIERAIPVDLTNQPPHEVAFGASVTVVDEDGERLTFHIVGEDEADAPSGKVSWVSPLVRALIGSRVGSIVTWERPAGDKVLRVTSIRYPSATRKGGPIQPAAKSKAKPAVKSTASAAPRLRASATRAPKAPAKAKVKSAPRPKKAPAKAKRAVAKKAPKRAKPKPRAKPKRARSKRR